VHVEWTTAQDADNINGDICLTKLKPVGHFPGSKVLRVLKASLGEVDGYLDAMLMGDRNEPLIKVNFKSRLHAEAYFNRSGTFDNTHSYAGYGFKVMSYVSNVTKVMYEARNVIVSAGGAPTEMGFASTNVDIVEVVKEACLTNYTLESLLNVKMITVGHLNYELSDARGGSSAAVYYLPRVKGMESDECAERLSELIKIPGTLNHDRQGVPRQTFMFMKTYELTCEDCDKKGHTSGSQFCFEKANSFVVARKAARAVKIDANRAKRARDEA
jgi:hypothetical protein